MKLFFLISVLPKKLRTAYYTALINGTNIDDVTWSMIMNYIDQFKLVSNNSEEIHLLLKYLDEEEKNDLINLIYYNHKEDVFLKNKATTFEDLMNIDKEVVKVVLSQFEPEDISKACMATSPQNVKFIEDIMHNSILEYNLKHQRSVPIAEITKIHDKIIESINEYLKKSSQ